MLNFSFSSIWASPKYRLVRQNLAYAVALFLFLFLGLSFLPGQLLRFNELKQEDQLLTEQIVKQESRLRLIESINIGDLNQLLILMNTLYPQQGDQFSINPVINNLEILTGMIFNKKSSPFESVSSEIIPIRINAIATQEQIEILLSDYPYKSARVLTLENISIVPSKSSTHLWEVDFVVIFHSGAAVAGNGAITRIDPQAIEFAQKAQEYFTSKGTKYTNISIKDEDVPVNYPIKQNPFND